MGPLERRRMLVRMGIAPEIPSLTQRRAWECIDSRKPPEGEADGQFDTFVTWVNKASSWIGWTGARCFDARDRPCHNGADMDRAKADDAFPVRWYWPERFPRPDMPDVRTLRVRVAVARAGSAGILIEELKARDGFKHVTNVFIAKAMEGRGTLVDRRWTMTAEGIEETRYEEDRAHRASCVS